MEFLRTLASLIFALSRYQSSLNVSCQDPNDKNHVIVETTSGKIRGQATLAPNGQEIVRFLGVPFGQAPQGDLRFKLPRKVEPWTGVFDADRLASACYQWKDNTFPGFEGTEIWNANTPMTEDCLNLNIWTPRNVRNASVMVWIYGGGFIYGSPSLELYDGEVLAAEGQVIVINVNYRTGPFGFLYFDQESQHDLAPGNMGLADQQLALRWIKENVKNFGGDPNRITLFGESAGAAGVSSHLFARGSWDYFNNIILQSGSITAPWATKSTEDATENGKRLASLCRCNRTSEREMIECLKKVPASELQNAAEKVDVGVMEFPFTAVAKDEHFFQGDVDELLKNSQFKKTALLMGSNSDEGTFWLPSYFREYFDNKNDGLIDRHQFDKSVDRAFGKLPKILRNSLSYHYQSTSNVTHFKNFVDNRASYRDALKRMMGDYYFSCDVMDGAERLADRGSTVYVYYFTERSSTNPWPKWMGVMHAYEIEYVFGMPIRKPQDYTSNETIFSRYIIAYWTNFAKNGFPSLFPADDKLPWPKYDKNKLYVNLNSVKITQGQNLLREDCKEWREVDALCTTAKSMNATSSTIIINSRFIICLTILSLLAYNLQQ